MTLHYSFFSLLLLCLIALENKSTITGRVRLADDVMIQLFRWQISYKFDSAVIHTAVLLVLRLTFEMWKSEVRIDRGRWFSLPEPGLPEVSSHPIPREFAL